ncbi:MAG: nucleotidyltransferase domain-containing protein [Ignisphaera sp.]
MEWVKQNLQSVSGRALRIAHGFVRKVGVELRKHGFILGEAYIVGSRARGDYIEESDIDIVLVVDGVEALNTLDRLNLVKDLLKPKLDIMVYSLEEWYSEASAWIRELKKRQNHYI